MISNDSIRGKTKHEQLIWLFLNSIGLNPLSPKSDQHQISPCNINVFVFFNKQSFHENYGHDHTR